MVENNLSKILKKRFDAEISKASNEQIYLALLDLTKGAIKKKGINKGKKKLYYISAEFLIGKLLSNNLINLGIYEEVKSVLAKKGKDLTEIEEVELEPSLGNGGLGRLAACFLDSIATLGLNGDGVGLNYHFGLFKQIFEDHKQKTIKNPWITKESWLTKSNIKFNVQFGGFTVTSTLYDIDVTGYNEESNKLHLFDIDTIDESLVRKGIDFDKEDIKKNLTLFLYPDDSDEAGQLLRVYQQYFMVSNAAQLILHETEGNGYDLHKLNEHVVIQINDTHPSMIIPELIRLLGEKGIAMSEAIEIVSKICAYTNHTILAEALEKWPTTYLQKVAPQLLPIIRELDNQVKIKFKNEKVGIIDKDNRINMAYMDIHYGFSVNGVAALHTKILKSEELKLFYDIYPQKFNNKTNGITFRRWLVHCNNRLANYISKLIGEDYKKDATKLEELGKFINDKAVLKQIGVIKKENKIALKKYLKETQNVEIDENSIFDIQIKRLHEYKRQQMNVLYIIYKYLAIKSGKVPSIPITMIFGAKAAPAYIIAQDIIHVILCLQEIINNDPEVNRYLKVVMVENYNVTKASKLIPALGTEDGANVEIHQLVGDDNIYIFGESSEAVIQHYKQKDYIPKNYYEKPPIKHLVDFIISDEMTSVGDKENLIRLHKELISKDWFMTLLDIEDYIKTKEIVFKDYENREAWNKKVLINISKAGFFSSDRTIAQYNEDIWKL
jgi:starch phosphorylase